MLYEGNVALHYVGRALHTGPPEVAKPYKFASMPPDIRYCVPQPVTFTGLSMSAPHARHACRHTPSAAVPQRHGREHGQHGRLHSEPVRAQAQASVAPLVHPRTSWLLWHHMHAATPQRRAQDLAPLHRIRLAHAAVLKRPPASACMTDAARCLSLQAGTASPCPPTAPTASPRPPRRTHTQRAPA